MLIFLYELSNVAANHSEEIGVDVVKDHDQLSQPETAPSTVCSR